MTSESADARESHEEVILCAGLEFSGDRELDHLERDALTAQKNRHVVIGSLWLAAIPLYFIPLFLVVIALPSVIHVPSFVEYLLAILGVLSLFVGVPIVGLKSRDSFKRVQILSHTLALNKVRRFEGNLSDDDWTDTIKQRLNRTELIDPEGKEITRLELHATDDVLYRVDGIQPQKWPLVELTRAAAAPSSPARFAMPSGWEMPPMAGTFERRRLTEGERAEITEYALGVRKRRWFYIPLLALGILRALELITSGLLKMPREMSLAISVALTLGIVARLFFRDSKVARKYQADSEYGWAFIIEPPKTSEENTGDAGFKIPVEVLPVSEAVWMVRGKPAGWRRQSLRSKKR